MTITDYAECHTCHTRIVWPVTATGRKLPPVNWAPDPTGTVAVQHTPTMWLGRVLGQGDTPPIFPEKRFRWHRETCTPRDAA